MFQSGFYLVASLQLFGAVHGPALVQGDAVAAFQQALGVDGLCALAEHFQPVALLHHDACDGRPKDCLPGVEHHSLPLQALADMGGQLVEKPFEACLLPCLHTEKRMGIWLESRSSRIFSSCMRCCT